MTLSRIRFVIQHLFLIFSLFAGRLGLNIGIQAMPCLTCSLVLGGCNGCIIRFVQFYMMFLSGPALVLGAEGYVFIKALVIAVFLSIFLGRIFCGFLCPFGLIQEWLSYIGQKLHFGPCHLSNFFQKVFKALKYLLILILFLVPPLVELGFFHPDLFYAFCQICPAGVILPLLAGQPTRVAVNSASIASTIITSISMFMTGMIIGLSMVVGRPWCRLCPLSVFHDVFKKVRLIEVKRDKEKCINCHKCEKICPMDDTINIPFHIYPWRPFFHQFPKS
jgi:polyferredoxin